MTTALQRRRRWRILRITTLIPVCLVSTIIITFLIIMRESSGSLPDLPPFAPLPEPPQTHLVYSAVPGFFAQSLPSTDDQTYPVLPANFGLIPQPYDSDTDFPPGGTPWQRFANKVMTLNAGSPKTTSYRVLFLSRHGEGYHNVAERFFGTPAWECFYSTLDGAPRTRWADAQLTATGIEQAEAARAAWADAIADQHVPTPQAFYASPLARALRTAQLTFADLELGDEDTPFRLIVKEGLREGIGIHTCDRRSSTSWLREHFPGVEIEDGFAEDDTLWLPDRREPGAAQTVRLRRCLDDVLGNDESLWISLTSHGGTIQSILRVVGHRAFEVKTGGLIPVLVKVEVVEGKKAEEDRIDWERKLACEGGEPGEEEVQERLRLFDESMQGTRKL